MVHRDIKPHNLMRTPAGQVKILDFGLARVAREQPPEPPDLPPPEGSASSHLTSVGAFMGTADYIAPEQAGDCRQADIRADVYSLGCTLYYLLTGHAPFPTGGVLDKLLKHAAGQPAALAERRPDLPAGLEAVVARMMAKQPAQRYPTPGAVADALAPYTAGRPAVAEPTAPSPAGGRRKSPFRWLVATAAALLFVLAAGGVVYRIQTDTGELVITTESPEVEVVIKQGGKEVRVLDTKTEKLITLVLRSGAYELELRGAPEGLKLDIDQVTLTRGETRLARIERVRRPEPQRADPPAAPNLLQQVRSLPWPGRNDFSTWFSEDSRLCMASSGDAFRVWGTETGQWVLEVPNLPPTLKVRFLPGGKQLLSSHPDGIFRRWDLETGELLQQFEACAGWNLIQGFSADGDCCCFWGGTGAVHAWDLKTGKERFRVEPAREKAVVLASAPVSPDGKCLLTVDLLGPEGSYARVFEVATGKRLLAKPVKMMPHDQTWSADSRRVYLNAHDRELNAHVIACLDVDTGDFLSKVPLAPAPGASQGRRFSRHTRYLAVQYPAANLFHLYDTRTGKLAGTAVGPNVGFSLSFSPNGRYIACGGEGEVLLYRVPEPPAGDKP
jgi:WD40 repeat protein